MDYTFADAYNSLRADGFVNITHTSFLREYDNRRAEIIKLPHSGRYTIQYDDFGERPDDD